MRAQDIAQQVVIHTRLLLKLRDLISLESLGKSKNRVGELWSCGVQLSNSQTLKLSKLIGGQIATYLIFFMIITLILIMVTVDIGEVSLRATTLSNAADSAALYLGSQIATQSNITFKNNDSKTKKCYTGGLAGIISAIVVAIIAVVLISTGVLAPLGIAALNTAAGIATVAVAAGAAKMFGDAYVAGTYRGAIGSFVQGAIIGAAIAGGAVYLNNPFALGPKATMLDAVIGVTTNVVLPTLAVAATAYNNLQVVKGINLTLDNINKSLNSLPPKTRFRAQAFLQALSATVDDPNMEKDNSLMFSYDRDNADNDNNPNTGAELLFLGDSDGDYNTDELVPAFQNWWWFYFGQLRFEDWKLRDPSFLNGFIDGPLTDFMNSVKSMYPDFADCTCTTSDDVDGNCTDVTTCTDPDDPATCTTYSGWSCPSGDLTRQEIPIVIPANTTSNNIWWWKQGGATDTEVWVSDGTVIDFLRRIESSGWWGFTFWEAGPDWPTLNNWYNPEVCDADNNDCPPPYAYDSLDALIDLFREFLEYANNIKNTSRSELYKDWAYNGADSWVGFLKNSNTVDGTDYYRQFGEYLLTQGEGEGYDFVGIQGWVNEIETYRSTLNGKTCTYAQGNINNFPCKISEDVYTIDADTDDEFATVLNILNNFMNAIRTFQTEIDNAFSGVGTILVDDKLTYPWTDSRGEHWVEVEVGPFYLANTYKTKSCSSLGCGWKKKTCIHLNDYADDGGAGDNDGIAGNSTYVKITRYDMPSGIARFWPWKTQTVIKQACVSYSYNHIELTRCP